MKKGLVFVVLVGFFMIASGCKKFSKKLEVVRDCSGVYLRKDNIDLKVCNEDFLANYSDGSTIDVKYDKLNECFGLIEEPACALFHEYESLIEVIKVK